NAMGAPIELDPLEGRVLVAGGRQLPGARVRVFLHQELIVSKQGVALLDGAARRGSPVVTVDCRRDGSFSAPLQEPAAYRAEVSHPGFASVIEAPIQITPLEPRPYIFFVLSPGLAIAGVVTDAAGHPLAGVPISLLDKIAGVNPSFHTLRSHSGAGGEFLFEGLEAREYVLLADPVDLPGRVIPSITPPREDLEVRIDEGVRIAGRVVDSEGGGPVEGAQISGLNPIAYDQAQSGADGSFSLHLAGEDADILIQHSGYVESLERITLGDPGPRDTHLFRLTPGQTIRGIVIREDGSGAAGVEVAYLASGAFLGEMTRARADGEGRFRLSGVNSSGSGTLLVREPGWAARITPGALPAPADGSREVLIMPTPALEGWLVDEGGGTVAGAHVRLLPPEQSLLARAVRWLRGEQEAWSGDDGGFLIPDVVPLRGYRLQIRHDDHADRIVLLENIGEPLEITLGPGAVVEGTIRTADGDPPLAAVVVAAWKGGPPVRRRRSGGTIEGGARALASADGSFSLVGISPGKVTLHVQAPPHGEVTREVAVGAGENPPIEITLPSTHGVRVFVVEGENEPVAGVALQLMVREKRGRALRVYRQAHAGSDGTFTFEGLPPGEYMIQATRPSRGIVGVVNVSVGPGDPELLEVEIHLSS
ncbi:MAG: hypothetical protein ACE5GW_07305, partial [Planctomycetota bacterium]